MKRPTTQSYSDPARAGRRDCNRSAMAGFAAAHETLRSFGIAVGDVFLLADECKETLK